MKFIRQCTRYMNGTCRFTGYNCGIKRESGESNLITSARETVCYWFTRDPLEGERVGGN